MMTFNVHAESEGLKLDAEAGRHKLVFDEGSSMGGMDQGPNPMQTALASLAACENITANMVAREMGLELEGIEFTIEGSFNPKGFMGDTSVRPYFETVQIQAKVDADASEEQLRDLQEKVEARCPVYTMMKAADVQFQDIWERA
ncbi:OsmC family protein [Alkalicoccus chagannorensis]|uniref:OsmC family protein n=1 Tax=Alkalicoccus chagannorensis TaxID=427072 RepID=UPI0003F51B05|nr:OsmC family protein [Alkalicoccus chagannorensis]